MLSVSHQSRSQKPWTATLPTGYAQREDMIKRRELTLAGAAAYTRSIRIAGTGRGGKARDETLEIRSLNNARALRGRKGKAADLGFKPEVITRVE